VYIWLLVWGVVGLALNGYSALAGLFIMAFIPGASTYPYWALLVNIGISAIHLIIGTAVPKREFSSQ